MKDSFGFTNDRAEYDSVCRFRDAAVADGWSIRPTYAPQESQDRASHLEKNGFVMSIISRTNTNKWLYEASIATWGPDSLAIDPGGEEYNWIRIQAGLRHCNLCKADGVDTKRYSFAGRACAKCLPEAKRVTEFPGWTS